ncbi:MAG: TolC family protein [Candidatus Zixiibacteriota bacterium]|nr:MAG: TolC family protein [candidate division Zixibacteria bacterium]
MRISWLVLLVVLTWSTLLGRANAQQEVLDSLIKSALDNNPELLAAAHMRQSTAYAARGAGALPDPMLSIGAMNLPVNSFSVGETPMSGVSVGFTQKIPWPGKLSARTDLATAHYRESKATEQVVRNRIIRQVTDAYLDYSFWSQSRSIIEQYLELLKVTQDIADVRYATGDAPAQDVLRVSSLLSRTEVRLLKADQNRYSSLMRLRRAVGDTTISLELPVHLAEDRQADSLTGSVEGNPFLASAASVVDQAETRRRLARREFLPDLMLGVDYRFRQNVLGDPVRGTDFVTFKIGVNLPLWFFAKQKHQVRSANQLVLASRQRERSIRDMLTTRYNDAASSLSTILESIDKYDSSLVPEAQAAVEAAEVAYEVGEVDFDALLTAQSDAFEIRLERLDLLRQYHQTLADLNELTGNSNER